MIDSIEHQSPFGKSDHSVLTFQFKCYTELTKHRGTRKNFVRADYENIKKQLNEIQWKAQLEGKTANEQWNYFKEKITNIFDKYVPKKTIKTDRKKSIPYNKKVLVKIRKKHHLRRKAIETNDPAVRLQYNKIRNQVRTLTRTITNEYEKKIARNAKEDPKAIWRYINSKSKTKEGIGNLLQDPTDKNSKIVETDKEKAEVLANYFSRTFTREPAGQIPTLERQKKIMEKWGT